VTGHIVDVIHHPAGYPANKDFAEFVFEISRWEKGEKAELRLISKINAILPEIQRNPEYLSSLFSSLFSSFSPSLFEIFSNLPALD